MFPMSSCRNALEELVIEEAEAQYKRLGADVKKRVDLSEVIAYTLNRLPPMYATTQRGWVQQRKKAMVEEQLRNMKPKVEANLQEQMLLEIRAIRLEIRAIRQMIQGVLESQ